MVQPKEDQPKRERKPSILATKYEESPFTQDGTFKVPVRQQGERLETEGPMAVVSKQGEVVQAAEVRRVKAIDADKFVKVFVSQLDAFYDLKPGTMRLVTAIMNEMSQAKNRHGDTIYLNYKRVSAFFEKSGRKPPAKGTFFSAMAEMTEKGFVAPSVDTNLWFINPAIFFNGDRIRFVTELRRKKRSKQEQLEDMGQQALALEHSDKSPEAGAE